MKKTGIFIYLIFIITFITAQNIENESMQKDTITSYVNSIVKNNDTCANNSFNYFINDERIISSHNIHFLETLKAKLPGADIYNASGRVGSSTRISLRGISINDDNKPLYIIDGVPYFDYCSSSYSLNGSYEFGNTLNDINTEDIENVEIISGVAASVLYGLRANNGVIKINTKKGEGGLKIMFNSSYSQERILRLPQFQNVFGQGIFGDWVSIENTSFGPKFDGVEHFWGNIVDTVQLKKKYQAIPDNIARFFELGHTFNNHLSISGGNEKSLIYVSYSNTKRDGIIPVKSDYYNRHTFTINTTTNLNNNLTFISNIKYLKKDVSTQKTGQGLNFYNNLLQTPRDIPVPDLSDYKNDFFNLDNYYSPYTTNPYFIISEYQNFNNTDNLSGRLNLNYSFLENFKVSYSISSNILLSEDRINRPVLIPEGYNIWANRDYGSVNEYSYKYSDLNSRVNIVYSKRINNYFVKIDFGQNTNIRESSSVSKSVYGLKIPNFYNLNNSINKPNIYTYEKEFRSISLYGNIFLAYRNFLFLNSVFRRDKMSSKPNLKGDNSYSINFDFIFTELLRKNNIINYGRAKIAYGKIRNEISPYTGSTIFFQPERFPLPSGLDAYTVGNNSVLPNFEPYTKSEYEVGVDFSLFNNFAETSITYYNQLVSGFQMTIQSSASTGYSNMVENIGKLSNTGFTSYLKLNPIRKENMNWSIAMNYSKNNSRLIELPDSTEYININGVLGGSEIWLRAYEGRPLGIFECSKPKVYVDDFGQEHIVVNSNGLPMLDTEGLEECGKIEHDYTIGITSYFSLYGFKFISVLDFKKGGKMFSGTASKMYFTGNTPTTLYNDRQPFIVPNSVIQIGVDVNGEPIYSENTRPVVSEFLGGSTNSYWNMGGTQLGKHIIVDRTYLKLRELSLNYTFKSRVIKKIKLTSLDLYVYGNNLLIWTPSSNNFIDPESSSFSAGINGKFGEYLEIPTFRSLGFGIKIVL